MENNFKRLGNYPKYEINREGIVRKIKSKLVLVPQKISANGEKEYVRVVHDGKAEFVRIGKLYATAFVKRESPKHNSLICKDGNWMNLSEENFVWIDPKVGYGDERAMMWRTVKGYEKLYVINENGVVKNIQTQKELNPFVTDGKKKISLHKNGVRHIVPVDKLVANAFLDRKPMRYIKHLDGDSNNCHYTNLAWTNNINRKNKEIRTPVNEYTVDGDFVKKWDSINDAAAAKCISGKNIYFCCIGKNKSAGGSVWRYEGDSFSKHIADLSRMPMEGETFVKFEEAEEYEISNKGRFRNLNRGGKIHVITKAGYVEYTANGEERHKKLGNVVAKYFMPNPHGCKRVEFIDGNPANCDVDNLRWVK